MPTNASNAVYHVEATDTNPNSGHQAVTRTLYDGFAERQGVVQTQAVESAQSAEPTEAAPDSGATAFNHSCTACHDAQKSLHRSKTYEQWLVTVRKMAAKDGADVPAATHDEIARYLASQAGMGVESPGPVNVQSSESQIDSALVGPGEAAFNASCTSCHDAQKSLQKSKSVAQWLATVRRMAAKDGADIPTNTHEAIANYLASLGSGAGGLGDLGGVSITGTLSPLWRGGDHDIQDPGFFGDVWLGAAWQGSGPVSAKATACISCHNEDGVLSRVELVEASVKFDLAKWAASQCGGCEPLIKTSIEAGRFVVPFGAFYQQVNPGVYRTVSRPLIYNMGQRVYDEDLGDPVLPMPYSDEGASFDMSVPLFEDVSATFDGYLVNGFQGADDGIDLDLTRDYMDNNQIPAAGARATIGGKYLKLGASVMSGRFNEDAGSGPLEQGMYYSIYGADASFHFEDLLRLQFEYARRDSDRLADVPDTTMINERIGGYYFEGEALVSRYYQLSLLLRYDLQSHHSLVPPPESVFETGDFSFSRMTYGVNKTLPGGSLLMLNLEHWYLPGELRKADVLGVRWAATF